jgi:SAM-dependent methyltransferase
VIRPCRHWRIYQYISEFCCLTEHICIWLGLLFAWDGVAQLEPKSFAARFVDRVRNALRRAGVRNPYAKITPGNWHAPPITQVEIDQQVEFALLNGALHMHRLQTMDIPVAGVRILEIGPGIAFGAVAYLRAAGAEVVVTDRWLAPWNDSFHGAVYAAIADRLRDKPQFDVTPLQHMVAERGYVKGTILCVTDAAEDLSSIADGYFDAVISNAVLEHIENPTAAFAELFRVTRSGGVGLHQVDFRDHRNAAAPLEHLLLAPSVFNALNRRFHAEYGSQLRQSDYASLFEEAGFLIDQYSSNDRAPDAYVDTVLRRLRTRRQIPATWTHEILCDLSGLFQVRKP